MFRSLAPPMAVGAILLIAFCQPVFAIEVKVGVYQNPPLIFIDENGQTKGIYADLLSSIAKREDWSLQYISGSFADLIELLERRDIDLLAAIAYSEERAARLDFSSETVLTNWGQIYTRPNSGIKSILDLDGKSVAVLRDDIFNSALKELAKSFHIQCVFVEADQYRTVFELLAMEEVDAAAVNRLWGSIHENRYGLVKSSIVFHPIEIRFAGAKDSSAQLLSAIDRDISWLKIDTGSMYYRSLDKWLGIGEIPEVFPIWTIWSLPIAGGLVLLFIAISLFLRSRVNVKTSELRAQGHKLQQEIEERKRIENARRESEEKYRDLVENINDVSFRLDIDGRFEYISPVVERITGMPPEAFIGKPLGEFIFDQDFPMVMEAFRKLKEGVAVTLEFRTPARNNSFWWAKVSARPLIKNGQLIGVTGMWTDISDRKKAEAEKASLELQLFHAQKMEAIGTLAGGVAHDFNNILSSILGYAELGLVKANGSDGPHHELTQILRAGQRAKKLVKQILTFSRKVEPELRPMDLNTQLAQGIELMKSTVPKMISIRQTFDSDLSPIKGDSVQIEQILMNLVTNAQDAMPEGGVLSIETSNVTLDQDYCKMHLEVTPGNYSLLKVADTGSGMDEETLGKIFNPFFTTKEIGKGTGLGLSTVFGIVKAHRGHIRCQSEPGKGTTFYLYFPALDAPRPAPDTDDGPADEAPVGNETILLVDDEEMIRDLGREILSHQGFSVITADSGEEALKLYHDSEKDIDLILLDVGMPGMGGHKCLEQLLEMDSEAKVALVSGYTSKDLSQQTLNSGAVGFIAKPFNSMDFLKTIRMLLDS